MRWKRVGDMLFFSSGWTINLSPSYLPFTRQQQGSSLSRGETKSKACIAQSMSDSHSLYMITTWTCLVWTEVTSTLESMKHGKKPIVGGKLCFSTSLLLLASTASYCSMTSDPITATFQSVITQTATISSTVKLIMEMGGVTENQEVPLFKKRQPPPPPPPGA